MKKRLVIAMCGILVVSILTAVLITSNHKIPANAETEEVITTKTQTPVTELDVPTETMNTTTPSVETTVSETETEACSKVETTTGTTTQKETVTTVPTTTTKPSTTVAPTTTVPTTQPVSATPSSLEIETLRLINVEREKVGLAPLTFNDKYYKCAQIRAQETTQKLSHTRPNGQRYTTVITDCGYPITRALGENIAYNFKTPEKAMNALMNSTTHKENILRGEFKSVAIAIVYLDNGYFTMVQLFEG